MQWLETRKIFDCTRLGYLNCLIKFFPRGGSGKALIGLIDEATEILVVLTLIGLKNTILGILKTRIFVTNYLDAYYCSWLGLCVFAPNSL